MTLARPSQFAASLEAVASLGATLTLTQTDLGPSGAAQLSATPDFASAGWQSLPLRQAWIWPAAGPRVVWVRFRDADGVVGPAQPIGPDVRRVYLPLGG